MPASNTLRSTVLWLSAVLTTMFGLALLFAPSWLLQQYGNTANDVTIIVSRLFGGVTLAFTVLAVMVRGVEEVRARRAVDATFGTAYLLITIGTVWNIAQYGTRGADVVVWTSAVIYALFTIAFGYFLLGPDLSATTGRARPMT